MSPSETIARALDADAPPKYSNDIADPRPTPSRDSRGDKGLYSSQAPSHRGLFWDGPDQPGSHLHHDGPDNLGRAGCGRSHWPVRSYDPPDADERAFPVRGDLKAACRPLGLGERFVWRQQLRTAESWLDPSETVQALAPGWWRGHRSLAVVTTSRLLLIHPSSSSPPPRESSRSGAFRS